MRTLGLICVALLLVAAGGRVSAQDKKPAARAKAAAKANPTEEKLKEIQAKLDEALRSAADSATALKAIQDLQRQVTQLQKDNEQQRGALRGQREAQKKVDEYERRIDKMELELAAMKLQMAGKGEVAGYHDGFFLQSPNRRFLIRFNGLLQAAFLGKIYSESRLYSDGVLGENASTFLIRRAGFALSGQVFVRPITYRLELDFGSIDPGPLTEGYIDLRPHRLLNLRVGRMKIPVGRQFLISSAHQQFVERSGATDAFVPGWDLGAMLHGEVSILGLLSWQLGMWNGAGSRVERDDNIDFLYGIRLNYEPFGRLVDAEGDAEVSGFRLAIGGSFAYNLARTDIGLRKGVTDPAALNSLRDKDGDGKIDNVGVYTVGIELAARYASIALQGELFYRREDPGNIGGDADLWGSYLGAYGQLGWFPLHRNFEVAARYSYWEPNNYGLARTTFSPRKVHEFGVVVNMLTWRRLIKWQIEYDHQWQRELRSLTTAINDGVNVNLVQVQVQVAF
jgi:hypothetical protein